MYIGLTYLHAGAGSDIVPWEPTEGDPYGITHETRLINELATSAKNIEIHIIRILLIITYSVG